MTNYREVLRLHSLGINHSQIAASAKCSRQTVISLLQRAQQNGITYEDARNMSDRELINAINDAALSGRVAYCRNDYGWQPLYMLQGQPSSQCVKRA